MFLTSSNFDAFEYHPDDPRRDIKFSSPFKTLETQITETAQATYKLEIKIVVFCAVAAIILIGIALVLQQNPRKREENKSHLVRTLFFTALAFGTASLVTLIISMGI